MKKIKRLISKLTTGFTLLKLFIFKVFKHQKEEIIKHFHTLAPTVLKSNKSETYLEALNEGIADKDINNIALTGPYGSGKSSIIKTFELQYGIQKFLNISLAVFNEKKDETPNYGDTKLSKLIELSILQQIIYKVNQNKIPDSRFKRITNLKSGKLWLLSILSTIWLLSFLLLLDVNFLQPFTEKIEDAEFFFLRLVCISVFFVGSFFLIKSIIRILNNSKISKFSIKGEIELGKNLDESILNKHLDEIIYFFEKTNYEIVVIEDLDRFGSTEIFTKLREINNLINSSEQINRKDRKITFIYAVKDDMFQGQDRTKFFDLIIPVIPIINPSNSNEKLNDRIGVLKGTLPSQDFIDDISLYINDMRLLNNISNEYQIYRKNLSAKLNQDNLLAMIVYKNMKPDDFVELHNSKGSVYSLLDRDRKLEIIMNLEISMDGEINTLMIENEKIAAEFVNNKAELNAIYLNKIQIKITNYNRNPFGLAIDSENFSFSDLTEGDYLEKLDPKATMIYYFQQGNGSDYRQNCSFSFETIEKEISEKSYKKRLQLIANKKTNRQEQITAEIEKLEVQKSAMKGWTTREIFDNFPDLSFLSEEERKNKLMVFLLKEGYINENYYDYISYFHEGSRTREDNEFLISVKTGTPLNYDFKLTKIENVLSKIQIRYFDTPSILNIDLLDTLLKRQTDYSTQLQKVIQQLSKTDKFILNFLFNYLDKGQSAETLFGLLGSRILSIWKAIELNDTLPVEKKNQILRTILNGVKPEDLSTIASKIGFKEYIESNYDFITSIINSKNYNHILEVLKSLSIKFESLSSEKQNEFLKEVLLNNLFQINSTNLRLSVNMLCRKSYPGIYTTLLNNKAHTLLKYIDDNINIFTKLILLEKDGLKEDTQAVIELLNHSSLEKDLKFQLIEKLPNRLPVLENIKSIEIKEKLLGNDKVEPTWPNIIDYLKGLEDLKISESLLNFLNNKENSQALAHNTIDDNTEEEKEFYKKICLLLLKNRNLNMNSYANLINSLPAFYRRWDYIIIEDLLPEQVEYMVTHKILTFTDNNYKEIKAHFPDKRNSFVEINESEFAKGISKLNLDINDFISLLSSKIKIKNKILLIERITLEEFDNSEALTDKALEILLQSRNNIKLNFERLEGFFKNSKSVENRVKLLLQNYGDVSNDELKRLVSSLGFKFKKIFRKQHKPRFDKKDYLVSLFDILVSKNLIKRYEEIKKTEQIRVIANY